MYTFMMLLKTLKLFFSFLPFDLAQLSYLLDRHLNTHTHTHTNAHSLVGNTAPASNIDCISIKLIFH